MPLSSRGRLSSGQHHCSLPAALHACGLCARSSIYTPRVCLLHLAVADSKAPQADATFFHRREFCFTLDGDIFVRYQAFRVSHAGRVHYVCLRPAGQDTVWHKVHACIQGGRACYKGMVHMCASSCRHARQGARCTPRSLISCISGYCSYGQQMTTAPPLLPAHVASPGC